MVSKILIFPIALLVLDLFLLIVDIQIGIVFGFYFGFLVILRALSSLRSKFLTIFSLLPFVLMFGGLFFGKVGNMLSGFGLLLIPVELAIFSTKKFKKSLEGIF